MSTVGPFSGGPGVCVNHPRTETALRCGKCGELICTRCMVQTPVGVRCRTCARLRRLPQYDVGTGLLARAGFAGLLTSLVTWLLVSFVPFLLFFLAILVGAAVGEVMSRLARRRTSLVLEATAVLVILLGRAAVEAIRFAGSLDTLRSASSQPSLFYGLLFPIAVASFVAVVKLR